MPLPGTIGAPVFRGADVTTFIEPYKGLSSHTGTELVAKDVITTFPYYFSDMIQNAIKMMHGYLRKDWEQLTNELKDAIYHANSRAYMSTRSYMERLWKDQLERGNVCLKGCILPYDNISHIMIIKGALGVYSGVEMLLWALPRDIRGTAVMKLEQNPRDPSRLRFDRVRKHLPNKCATPNARGLLDWDGTRKALGVTPYSNPAGVRLPQMPVVVNLPAILSEESPPQAQAMEEIPITKAENTIDTKMDNSMKAFEAWTLHMSKANEPRYGGYRIPRAYTT